MYNSHAKNKRVPKRISKYFVYIVECKGQTFYTGYTHNLEKRLKRHNNKTGSKYLRGKLPVRLVYAKKYRYYKSVLRAERDIKKLSRKQKEDLVKSYSKRKGKTNDARSKRSSVL